MPSTPAIRTVLGDVAPAALGVCDAHDHLFLRSPHLTGQELDDEARAADELRAFRAAGGAALVQWTPRAMGRRRESLVRLARTSGVRLVAATGLHQARQYGQGHALLDRAAQDFVADLTTAEVPAGLIKVSTGPDGPHGTDGLDPWTRRVMAAAAEAQHATGCPVGVHLERPDHAEDAVALLSGKLGVPPERILLGHLGRTADADTWLRAAATGAHLVLDGPSAVYGTTDERVLAALVTLAGAGYGDRLLLGADTTTSRAAPGRAAHLLDTLRPSLVKALGEEAAERVFVANPARAFSTRWSVPRLP
ncbi:amidohydrolase family protein [Streptomyces sp. NPDC048442]|uniref:phosphotriesterase family protein n=1 Tax=Streptomyces sp. NPDC048442 TaxID=3154823 RepID=UPI0034483E20